MLKDARGDIGGEEEEGEEEEEEGFGEKRMDQGMQEERRSLLLHPRQIYHRLAVMCVMNFRLSLD